MPFVPLQMTFYVHLPNFPEWAIPMTKIIPKARIDDGWDMTKVTFDGRCRHWWKKIGETDWQLKVEVTVRARIELDSGPLTLPTYLDLDMVILNERVWEELNPNKS